MYGCYRAELLYFYYEFQMYCVIEISSFQKEY